MTIVIPFFVGDSIAAKRLIAWIGDLGGCPNHDLMLCADAGTPYDLAREVRDSAKPHFRSVTFHTNGTPVMGWIPGSNSLFYAAAFRLQGQPFFWMEPDATPTRAGWMDEIEAAYKAGGKPYMGTLVKHNLEGWPNPYMEGVAVYGPNAYSDFVGSTNPDVSWTNTTAGVAVPQCNNTPLIHHIWGESGRAPTFSTTPMAGTEVMGLDVVRPEAVVFHRNKDGSLIKLLKARMGVSTPTLAEKEVTFGHGGDVGDLIYGLCAIKAYGGGRLALFPHSVREHFTAEKAARVMPLLSMQPYITDVGFEDGPITPFGSNDKPACVDINLNKFRELQFSRRHNGQWETISETHLRLLGLPLHHANTSSWLQVDAAVQVPGKPVIVNRTERYQNTNFPWKRVVDRYRHQMAFVGSPKEHRDFQNAFGNVKYYPTPELADLARVIAGAKLFIGNQSTPYAIAEGLKRPAILECCEWCPDCVFSRPDLIVGRSEDIPLPSV